MKFNHSTLLRLFLFATTIFVFIGCGPSTGSKVIQSTEDYQPTEQELLNEADFDAMREQQ